ncbi:MAG TPA: elongation factor G [Deltaproteobacteria bacterium]|jgi:elongation factor G|nr:elongation factor G [Deltaproteobacteria bacterium]
MRRYRTENIRDVVILSHSGSGKTSLGEALLFNAKATTRLGKVLEGNSVLDFEPEEQKRQSSIFSALHTYKWKNTGVTILDTPGDSNFSSEAILGMKSADNALFVIDAIDSIKPHSENLWGLASKEGLARFCFINKMDRERADFDQVLADISEQFEIKPLVLTLPIGAEDSFKGVVDVLKKKAYLYEKDGSGKFSESEIPADMKDKAEEVYGKVVEDLAEVDDALMEKYLEGGELTPDELASALSAGLAQGVFLPVFAGSAILNMGVQPLMDFINSSGLSPDKRPLPEPENKQGEKRALKAAEDEPFCGYVFKTMSDPYTGTLSVIRCYSGTLKPDSSVFNSSRDIKERIGTLLLLEGKAQKPVEEVGPGDIFAIAKLKETKTGDTLFSESLSYVLPSPEFPEPIMNMAVNPKTKADVEKIMPAMQKLMDEDPVLKVFRDEQTGEFILSGLGQLHIEIIVDRLKRRFGVDVELKTPRVPYKETITASCRVQGKHKKQTGGHGQYGDAWIKVEPLDRGGGFEFVNAIVGGVIPKQYIPAVEKGVIEAMQNGPLTGNPVVDVKVTLDFGSYHEVDSSEMAFKIAGSLAFKKAMEECRPILLEPIMKITVVIPEETMGDVMGDLNSRRARIEGMNARGKYQELKAQVPLAEVLTYAPTLTSLTSGRGTYTMSFSHMDPVPYNLQEKIVQEVKAEKDGK